MFLHSPNVSIALFYILYQSRIGCGPVGYTQVRLSLELTRSDPSLLRVAEVGPNYPPQKPQASLRSEYLKHITRLVAYE